jgi:F420-dependent oxidoreductase-like protein
MATHALQLPQFAFPDVEPVDLFGRLRELAQAADAGGWDSIWVMDHFWQLPPLGGPAAPILESATLLGALAAVTERVGLGALVNGVTYRNPALLAKITTTLDVVSRGRAWLGLGAAWYEPEHDGLGFDYPADRVRLDMLEEALIICKGMLRDESPTYHGTHFRVTDAKNVPAPVQPGGVRILVGGGGEKRTLKLVAQHADACNIGGDPAMLRHKVDVLHGHCAAVGRDPADILVTRLGSLFPTGSAAETAQLREMLAGLGDPEQMAGFLIGEAGAITEAVHELVEAGAQLLIFNLPFASTAAQIETAGEILAAATAGT